MAKSTQEITYLDARPQDVESLKTIVPRAFFAVNERMKTMLPDTPAMRAWWGRIFEELVTDPNSHVAIAIDTSTNEVVGAIILDAVLQGQQFGGYLIRHPPTEDHDAEDWLGAIKSFAKREEETIGDRNRFLVEIMGVDSAYQGLGIGQQVVANACKMADAKGWPIYLETSAAKGFYLKQSLGFQAVAGEDDPEAKGGRLLREAGAKG